MLEKILWRDETEKVCKPISEISFEKCADDLLEKAVNEPTNKKKTDENNLNHVKDELIFLLIYIVERLQTKLNINSLFFKYDVYICCESYKIFS